MSGADSQTTVDVVEVRAGQYRDSVTLMLLSRTLTEDPAVDHAIVAMGTALNLELLVDAGYQLPEVTAGDLILAFRGREEAVADTRLLIDRLLNESGRATGAAGSVEAVARTLRSAAAMSGANVALISVPGQHAFRQAVDDIEAGLHPIIFSDNVTVAHEVVLKRMATEAGLLAMGPDCGTVLLDGVAVGFANVVSPGPIGLVSASGTGAQQVCALCDQAGVGVRHALGLGGRDLSDDVGGLSALAAIRLLDDDPGVEVIGVIAKEIGQRTRPAVDELLAQIETPTVIIPGDDLVAGTRALLSELAVELPAPPTWSPAAERPRRPGRILGLYSGGTLAGEAVRMASEAGADAEIIDLGDDEYTRGRPHPMIDYRLRLERLVAADSQQTVGAILLDVVLGHGFNPDPAAELGPALAEIGLPVYVALVGTAGDPQGHDRQAEALAEAGATVFASNAAAVTAAVQS